MGNIRIASLLLISTTIACGPEPTQRSRAPVPRMLTERQWLAMYDPKPLTAAEEKQVAAGEVLWARVDRVRGDGDLQAPFITTTGIRVLPVAVQQRMLAMIDALPERTDPIAVARVRKDLGLVSDVVDGEGRADTIVAQAEGSRTAEMDLFAPDAAPMEGSDAGTMAGSDAGSTAGSDAGMTEGTDAGVEEEYATSCEYGDPECGPVEEKCKVTCNLSISTKGNAKEVDWSNTTYISDSSGIRNSADIWNTNRQSHIVAAFTCTASGCENRTWSANVSPANMGDGTMSATVAAATRNPVLGGWSSGCEAEARADASQTALVLSHNTNDCNGATRLPSTGQALKLVYKVNSETKFTSGNDASGSFSINYNGNVTAANDKAVNFSAAGNGLDDLKVDGVKVVANAQNNTKAEVNAGAAAASSWRYAEHTDGNYKTGGDTLSFLNQVTGPPSLNLTNVCPQKSVSYKYDIVGLQAIVNLASQNQFGSGKVFCSASIKASLPAVPEKINFACIYSVQGSTDTHDCTGTQATTALPYP